MPRTSQQSSAKPVAGRATTNAATGSAAVRKTAPERKPTKTAEADQPTKGQRTQSQATKTPATKAARNGDSSPEPAVPEQPAAPTAGDPVDVNLVVLGGHLAADAELRTYESGARAMRFLVTIRLSEPRRRIDVLPVTVWDPGKDLTRKPPVRGDRIWFTGNVQRRFWDGPDGRRSRVEVVAHNVERDTAATPGTTAAR